MDLTTLSLTELFLMKQWVRGINNAGTSQNTRKIIDLGYDVDKELWKRLISEETPWDDMQRYSADPPKRSSVDPDKRAALEQEAAEEKARAAEEWQAKMQSMTKSRPPKKEEE